MSRIIRLPSCSPAYGCSGKAAWRSSSWPWRSCWGQAWLPGAWRKRKLKSLTSSGERARARLALKVYILFSAVAFVAIWLAGAGPFDALMNTLAAVSTGGFSNHNIGLAGAGGLAVQIVVTFVSFGGAISLMLYLRAWQGNWRDVVADVDLRAVLLAALACAVLVGLCMVLVGGRPWTEALRHAPLIAVSAQTTTGFATFDLGSLDPASKLVLIGSMFVGGDAGSTAGGIKIVRLLVLLALIRLFILRTRLPSHAVAEPELSGHRLAGSEVYAVIAVVLLHAVVIGVSWFFFVAGGHAALDALFEVTSAVATVGLSTGITSAALAPALKVLLTADMLLGRLEIVAFIVLLYPPTWIGRRAEVP